MHAGVQIIPLAYRVADPFLLASRGADTGRAYLRHIQAASEGNQDLLVIEGLDTPHIHLVRLPLRLVLAGREQKLSNAGGHQCVFVMGACITASGMLQHCTSHVATGIKVYHVSELKLPYC